MGATLADGGVNPVTGVRVIEPVALHARARGTGHRRPYERSGDWLFDIGLPGKSGVSGGIVTIAPGKGGMAVLAKARRGRQQRAGQLVTRYLSERSVSTCSPPSRPRPETLGPSSPSRTTTGRST